MKQIAILVAVLLIALIFNSILPKAPESELDRDTLERFIIEDAKETYGEQASYRIVKYEPMNGKWYVELDVTLTLPSSGGPEDTCKKTIRRYYNLFPIVFREELYSNSC